MFTIAKPSTFADPSCFCLPSLGSASEYLQPFACPQLSRLRSRIGCLDWRGLSSSLTCSKSMQQSARWCFEFHLTSQRTFDSFAKIGVLMGLVRQFLFEGFNSFNINHFHQSLNAGNAQAPRKPHDSILHPTLFQCCQRCVLEAFKSSPLPTFQCCANNRSHMTEGFGCVMVRPLPSPQAWR